MNHINLCIVNDAKLAFSIFPNLLLGNFKFLENGTLEDSSLEVFFKQNIEIFEFSNFRAWPMILDRYFQTVTLNSNIDMRTP